MTKKIFYLLLINALTTIDPVIAQTYAIKTFEGNNADVNLYYKPASGALSISCQKDTIVIDNYWAVDDIRVLDKVFLQINYAKRGGSNEGSMNQLLLYVSNGKLGQALHVSSYSNYDLRPAEYSLFKLRVTLSGHDIGTYKLRLDIHNENRSQKNPKSDFKYDTTGFLTFDKKNKCFYSTYGHVTGDYTFDEFKNTAKMRHVRNKVPVVVVGKAKYYYIEGNWFSKYKDNFYSMLF